MDAPERVAEQPPPPIKFSLASAFFGLAVICVLLAEYQALGVQAVGAWWFTLLLAGAYVLHRLQVWAARNLALGTFLVTGFCALLPSLGTPIWFGWQSRCLLRLQHLAHGANGHEQQHGSLPQDRIVLSGPGGLSWRVSLLPFVHGDAVYKKFDLMQSWQSSTNRPLADLTIPEYRCPAETNTRHNETSYVAITGDDTCWPSIGPLSLQKIPDGASNTILFTETHDSGILWPEPRDLEYDKLDWRIHGTPGNSISSSHGPAIRYFDGSRKLKSRQGVNVAMADGSTLRLNPEVDPEVLKQMANRRDGLPKELP